MGVKAGVEPGPLWHAMRQGAIGRGPNLNRVGDRYLQEASIRRRCAGSREQGPSAGAGARRPARRPDARRPAGRGGLPGGARPRVGEPELTDPAAASERAAGVTIRLSANEVQAVLDRGRPAYTPTRSGDDMSTADAADVKTTGRRIMNG